MQTDRQTDRHSCGTSANKCSTVCVCFPIGQILQNRSAPTVVTIAEFRNHWHTEGCYWPTSDNESHSRLRRAS